MTAIRRRVGIRTRMDAERTIRRFFRSSGERWLGQGVWRWREEGGFERYSKGRINRTWCYISYDAGRKVESKITPSFLAFR